jgi:uncharacterized membrane protein YbhN (UPF0104 family)
MTRGRAVVVLLWVGAAAAAGALVEPRPSAPAHLVAAILFATVAPLSSALVWGALLRATLDPPFSHDVRAVLGAFLLGSVVKYAPGKVGSLVARGALLAGAVKDATPRNGVAAASVAGGEAIWTLAVAGAISSVVASAHAPRPALAVGLGALAAVAVVVGAVIARRRLAARTTLPAAQLFIIAAAPIIGWLAQGAALWCVANALGAPHPYQLCVGAAAAAVVAGVVSPTPAGVGAREVVVVAALSAAGDEAPAAMAVWWRAVSVVADVGLAGLGALTLQAARLAVRAGAR